MQGQLGPQTPLSSSPPPSPAQTAWAACGCYPPSVLASSGQFSLAWSSRSRTGAPPGMMASLLKFLQMWPILKFLQMWPCALAQGQPSLSWGPEGSQASPAKAPLLKVLDSPCTIPVPTSRRAWWGPRSPASAGQLPPRGAVPGGPHPPTRGPGRREPPAHSLSEKEPSPAQAMQHSRRGPQELPGFRAHCSPYRCVP